MCQMGMYSVVMSLVLLMQVASAFSSVWVGEGVCAVGHALRCMCGGPVEAGSGV